MIKSYLKIAIRNFVKDRVYTVVNLSSLAIGLASVLMIFAYVRYELSYDRYYSNSNRIFRLISDDGESGASKSVLLPSGLSHTLKAEFTEIEAVTFLRKAESEFIINDEPVKFNVINTDTNFFHVFNLPFVFGNGQSAFKDKNDAVITENIANTYFPNQDAIGKYLIQKNYNGHSESFKITGVIKNIPGNTHFNTDIIIGGFPHEQPLNWTIFNPAMQYLLLKKNISISSLTKRISAFYRKYNFPEQSQLSFQPVTSIHLHSNIADEPFSNGDIKYVYIFSIVALLILLIASINYINLTTARSLRRIREVGVRKLIGAEKWQLAFQFISESALFFLLTLPFAFLIAYAGWDFFKNAMDIQQGSEYLLNGNFIFIVFSAGLISGILSGLYPAFFLSSLPTARIFNQLQNGLSINMAIGKTLIVFQFVISVMLIFSAIVIYLQLHLLNNVDLGFNKNNLIVLPTQSFGNKAQAFKNELKSNNNIYDVSIANWQVGNRNVSISRVSSPDDTTRGINFAFVEGDFDFINTMQLKLLRGRNFSPDHAEDMFNTDSTFNILMGEKMSNEALMRKISSRSIIITEQTAKALQLKEPIEGQRLTYHGLQGTVIGEVKDFLGLGLFQQTPLVVIQSGADMKGGYTYIRIASKNTDQTIAFIQKKWKEFFPASNFNFSFVDERVQHLYDSQTRLAIVFNCFAVLSIIIAVMGLFSLVALTVQHKTKEIGIRKVLGAGVIEIVRLLSVDFFKLILVAITIALPLSWWSMNKWLQDFNHRITISWWIFFAAGFSCLCFAIAVAIIQSAKAAMANPVDSLRSE